MIPLRLYIYAGIALAFVGLLVNDHFKTKRLNKAKQELALATAQVGALEIAAKKDTRIADELATFRAQQSVSFRQFDETLRTSKVTREIRYENGTCVVRDPALYRKLFNDAYSEAPGP
jgi:hypothetical protein